MHEIETSVPRKTPSSGYTPSDVRTGMRFCMLAWYFGASFFSITGGAAYTAFLTKYLKTNDSTYGLMLSIVSLAMLFQVLGSYVVERTGRSKRQQLIFATTHRLLWLGVAAIPLLWPVLPHRPTIGQVMLTGVITALSGILGSFGGAGWSAWMSDLIPKSVAGSFFGMRARIGLMVMSVSALLAALFLDYFAGTRWVYALVFSVAAILGAIDILCFIPVREVPRQVEATPPTLTEIAVTPWKSSLFRWFSLYTLLMWSAIMMMGNFAWRYCYEPVSHRGLGLNVMTATLYLTVIPLGGMALVAPFWGRAIDRFGPKSVLAVATLGHLTVMSGWMFLSPGIAWVLPVMMFLSSIFWPGVEQVIFFMQLRGFADHRRSAYAAMFCIVMGVAAWAGTVLGGYYAEFWERHRTWLAWLPSWFSHYHPIFITGIMMRLAAHVLIFPKLPLEQSESHLTITRGIAEDIFVALQRGLRIK